MSTKATKDEENLSTNLLKQLTKLEIEEANEGRKGAEFQFERNILSAVGMTYERELELMKQLVGERWSDTETVPDSTR